MLSDKPFAKHMCPINIRFVDIDAFGHVNNAHYLTFAEQGRMSYFAEVFGEVIDWKHQGFILASATVDYKIPVLLNDKISVYLKCVGVGSKSFTMEYALVEETNAVQVVKALMKTVLVAYDYLTLHSILVPEEWTKRLKNYDNF